MAAQKDFGNWPGCPKCKHFVVNEKTPIYTCAAFPDGIRIEHKSGSIPHVTPSDWQENEIVFEPLEE